jgi:DNA-binding response OmpR family regulator
VFLIQEAIRSAKVNTALDVVADGEQALSYIEAVERDDAAECPALIILDINLPKRHGGEVLERLRRTAKCGNATVLVVTSSDSSRDRESVAPFGISGYFRKPSEYDDFMKLGQIVKGLLSDSR